MDKLTPSQQRTLDAIKDYMAENQISPSYRDIAEKLSYRGTNGVCEIIHRLQDKGYLKLKKGNFRSIVVLDERDTCPYCDNREHAFQKITHLAMEMLEMVEKIHKSKSDRKIVTMNALARDILMFSSWYSSSDYVGKHEDRIHKLLVQQINTKQKIIEEEIKYYPGDCCDGG